VLSRSGKLAKLGVPGVVTIGGLVKMLEVYLSLLGTCVEI